MKKILILFIFCLLTNKVYSQELLKTLSSAFKNNSKLNAEREGLNASKQDVNISIGEFLPSITLSGNIATQDNTNRTNQSGATLADTTTEPSSKSILIEQKIFDGFTNYNDVKKSQLELRYAQIKLNKLEQEVLLDAAKAYYGLGYSVKNLEFNQSNFDLLVRVCLI